MGSNDSYDTIVVGAGAVGCAIARELASENDVLVVDKTGVGSEASGLAAGLTSPTLFEYNNPEVAKQANQYLENFSGTAEFTYHQRSRIELVSPECENDARIQAERMANKGFPVEYTTAEMIEEEFSLFDLEGLVGAIEIKDAGYIDDTYVYTRALAHDAASQGAEFRTTEVTGPATENGELIGIETTDRTIGATTVVFAAGWRTSILVSDILSIPTRPFILQCANVDLHNDFHPEFPLGRLPSEKIYFRPQQNGRLRLGGGEFFIDDPESYSSGVVDSEEVKIKMEKNSLTAQEVIANGVQSRFANQVRETVPQFIEGFDTAGDVHLESGWSGVDGATADGEPIIDSPDKAPEGLIIATGFNGLGITKSPIAALGARALITDDAVPFSMEQFALDRLPQSLDFELSDTFAMGTE